MLNHPLDRLLRGSSSVSYRGCITVGGGVECRPPPTPLPDSQRQTRNHMTWRAFTLGVAVSSISLRVLNSWRSVDDLFDLSRTVAVARFSPDRNSIPPKLNQSGPYRHSLSGQFPCIRVHVYEIIILVRACLHVCRARARV